VEVAFEAEILNEIIPLIIELSLKFKLDLVYTIVSFISMLLYIFFNEMDLRCVYSNIFN